MRCSSLLLCATLLCALLPLAFSASHLTNDGFVPNAGSISYADVRGKPYTVDYGQRGERRDTSTPLPSSHRMPPCNCSPALYLCAR